MAKDIKASIIVITYNQQGTIHRAVESVLRQKCDYPIEIIIADDASSDGTREICEEYARRYPDLIRLLPKAPNKGLVGNYFDAFEAARGEYVSDCAGDDEWIDDRRLARQIEFLDDHPECSVCYCDVEVFTPGRERVYHSDDKVKSRYFLPHVRGEELMLASLNHVTALPYTLSAALYRKSVVEKIYEKDREIIRNEECGVEDVPILVALGAGGDGGYLPIKGYRYYIDGESISNNLSFEKEYRFHSRILRLTRRLADYYNVPHSRLKQHYQTKISHIAAQARHANRRDLVGEIQSISREWGLPIPLRGRAHLFLLRHGIGG